MPPRDLLYHDLLIASVEQAPEREALVFLPPDPEGALRMTYRELDEAVARTARALLACGVERGGVVAVYAANRPEFVFVQFACSRIGAATVPINPLYEADELAYVLERAGAELCFADHRHRDAALWARLSAVAAELPSLRLLVALSEETTGAVHWDEWLAGGDDLEDGRLAELESSLDPRATVQIQFTSGTTGRPKAVQLSGYGLANGGHR